MFKVRFSSSFKGFWTFQRF